MSLTFSKRFDKSNLSFLCSVLFCAVFLAFEMHFTVLVTAKTMLFALIKKINLVSDIFASQVY